MSETTECRILREFSYYYDLYVPDGELPKPLIIAMHGYGGDKSSMMRVMRRINERDYVIACLQGPHQHIIMPDKDSTKPGYGFGWLTNFKSDESVALHHSLVLDIIRTMKDTGQADPERIFLLGFSQAVGVNFRFAFTHPQLVRGVVAICGGIPGDWESEGKYQEADFDVLYLGAERDEFYAPERIRRNAELLSNRAASVDLQFFDVEHEVPREAYPVIDEWLAWHL